MNHEDLHPEDLLRGRVVDRCDGLEDWDALEALGASDPTTWLRLARDLRLDCEIRGAAGPALRRAAAAELPTAGPTAEPKAGQHDVGVAQRSRGFAWVGWAAAALLAVLWWVDRPVADPRGESRPEFAIVDPRRASEGVGSEREGFPLRELEAADWKGRVRAVGGEAAALPGMLVEATPSPSGRGLRVVYVHRELREATVEQAFSIDGEASVSAAPLERYETPTEF